MPSCCVFGLFWECCFLLLRRKFYVTLSLCGELTKSDTRDTFMQAQNILQGLSLVMYISLLQCYFEIQADNFCLFLSKKSCVVWLQHIFQTPVKWLQ